MCLKKKKKKRPPCTEIKRRLYLLYPHAKYAFLLCWPYINLPSKTTSCSMFQVYFHVLCFKCINNYGVVSREISIVSFVGENTSSEFAQQLIPGDSARIFSAASLVQLSLRLPTIDLNKLLRPMLPTIDLNKLLRSMLPTNLTCAGQVS